MVTVPVSGDEAFGVKASLRGSAPASVARKRLEDEQL